MTTLCFIDTETTGLDPRIHQPYEVCIWREDWESPNTFALRHDLTHADGQALAIGDYFGRRFGEMSSDIGADPRHIASLLHGATLVGSNPAFDAAMLTRYIGAPVWHHRLINVAEGGMWVFGWDRPKGLADVANECRDRGYEIPEPDHTAEGDVRATRAVYEALRAITATPAPHDGESLSEQAIREAEQRGRDAVLADLRERLEGASTRLRELVPTYREAEERARLSGKREGVNLALSYVEEAERLAAKHRKTDHHDGSDRA